MPFIARWPGRIPADSESDRLLSLTDLFPTIAAATGTLMPRDAAPDGLNQLPLLEHPMDTPAIRTEMVHNGNALRSGDWVYLPKPGSMGAFGTFYFKPFGYKNSQHDAEGNLSPDALPDQLYNLREDSSQRTNLAAERPEIASQLAARLKEIQRQSKSK